MFTVSQSLRQLNTNQTPFPRNPFPPAPVEVPALLRTFLDDVSMNSLPFNNTQYLNHLRGMKMYSYLSPS